MALPSWSLPLMQSKSSVRPSTTRCHRPIVAVCTGKWTQHSRYGKQFKIEQIHYLSDRDAIRALLCGGFLKGIKSAKATVLVDTYGDEVFAVLDAALESKDQGGYDRLVREVKGIGPKNVIPMMESWEKQRYWAKGALECIRAGLTLRMARKARSKFGHKLAEVIRKAPYRLTQVRGITWQMVDVIAKKEWPGKAAIGHDDPQRYAAAVREVLRWEHGKGHMCLPVMEAMNQAHDLAQPNQSIKGFAESVLSARKEEGLVCHGEYIYAEDSYKLESETARRVAGQLEPREHSEHEPEWPKFNDLNLADYIGFELATGQKHAVKQALEHRISVITGGPGTGKTTTLACIVNIARTHNLEVVLCAPTGKAARRMFEATRCEASTIHRALGIRGEERRCNFAGANLVLIDEASMIDAQLMWHIIQATPPRAHLVLIGDVDQLPSVGPGEVLYQIINSGVVPVTYLAVVHRQAENSGIIQAAHAFNAGVTPDLAGFADAFIHQVARNENLAPTLLRLLPQIMDKHGFDVHEVCVLTPVNRRAWGQLELNEQLRRMFNPGPLPLPGVNFKEGDPAMHIKNNYGLGVLNGMVGPVIYVATVEEEEKERQYIADNDLEDEDGNILKPVVVKVEYPDRGTVGYTRDDLDELVLAYAMTIHKSQGSEYPAVVMVTPYVYEPFMVRALPYTGATRAKEYLFVLSAGDALERYITNEDRIRRHTNLGQMISEFKSN